jgi:L,D-transpeptidase catalytic domain
LTLKPLTETTDGNCMSRGIRPVVGLVCAAAGFAVFAAPSLAAERVDPAPPPPGQTAVLSNERTLTLSAYVADRRPIYAKPRADARRMGRLRLITEDGYPEIYLVLRAYTDAQGREWTQIRIPGRPNGRVGWVRREALQGFRATHWQLVLNRRRLTMTLYWNGKRRWQRPVGIGKHSTPTPPGNFWIRERIKVKNRLSPYWPYALGTADYSTLSEWPAGGVVGIHGDWNQPQLIPGRPSHGCIRMHDQDIGWLAKRIDIGTPLRII